MSVVYGLTVLNHATLTMRTRELSDVLFVMPGYCNVMLKKKKTLLAPKMQLKGNFVTSTVKTSCSHNKNPTFCTDTSELVVNHHLLTIVKIHYNYLG